MAKTRDEAKRLLKEEDTSRRNVVVATSFLDSETKNKSDDFSDQWLLRQNTFWPLVRLVQNGYSDDREGKFVKIGVTTLRKPFEGDRLAKILEDLSQKNVVAKDWPDLQRLLLDDSWNPRKEKFISPFVFRGLDDAAWRLKTKFIRLINRTDPIPPDQKEDGMIRSFRKYADRFLSRGTTFWHRLSLGQHYGLASRLMDWTYSPLVALHFATKDEKLRKKDGVVWAVSYVDAHKREKESAPTKRNGRLPCRVKDLLDKQGGDLFTVETLSNGVEAQKGFEDLREFDKEGSEHRFVLFFEPPSFDQRIISQFAVFSVASDRSLILDDWLEESRVDCRRIMIPWRLKPEIREKLDQCNISERTLFPGLDGICSLLNRHYGPPWHSNSNDL